MSTPLEEAIEFVGALNDPDFEKHLAEVRQMNEKHATKPRKGREDRREQRRFKNSIKGWTTKHEE